MTEELNPVFCSSCGQAVAWSWGKYPAKSRIFCGEFCSHESPLVVEEERADMWQALLSDGWTHIQIGREFAKPHSLVYKTMERLTLPVDVES